MNNKKDMKNNVDKQYLDLLRNIINNGVYKNSRSGGVLSLFGGMMKFNLQDGLPVLTTKKVFTKGIIHELLWFLSGNTNIKYLIENNVHIWDDDAFRWFNTVLSEDCEEKWRGKMPEYVRFEIVDNNNDVICTYDTLSDLKKDVDKNKFIDYTVKNCNINVVVNRWDVLHKDSLCIYKFGNLGNIYSKQWRDWHGIDQIKKIILTLKTNPDDRRMVLSAWNVADLDKMALPPCHMFAVFNTREMDTTERLNWLCENSNGEYDEWVSVNHETLDKLNVPRRVLNCDFTMRSNDFCCGNPYNIAQYAILTHMIAHCVNMVPGQLIYHGIDIHVYENHLDNAKIQMERDPYKYELPKLWLNPLIKDIDKFTYDDIKIIGYNSYPSIKYPLNVG